MIERDIDIFYWINSHHTPWLDWVMWVASQGWSWAIVLVAAIVYLTVGDKNRGSHSSPKLGEVALRAGGVCLGIGLCFLLSDRISVLCFKDVFCRLRPCHALENVRMFQTSCGGLYGFVSSHAANVFALALFLSLWHRKHTRRAGHTPQSLRDSSPNLGEQRLPRVSLFNFQLLIFFWASLVGYSRPYLGKHYPGDVLCGALLGLLVGTAVFFIVQATEKWADKLLSQKKTSRR